MSQQQNSGGSPADSNLEENGKAKIGSGAGNSSLSDVVKSNGATRSRTASAIPVSNAIEFLTIIQSLKIQKRQGWVNHSVREPESIADHMHRMCLMALLLADIPGVDRDRCVKIAAVHDIAEAIVGDITPDDRIEKSEKSRRERAAMDQLCRTLGDSPAAVEMRELWEEYEANETMEAKLVKDFDKAEMILQALEYEKAQGLVLNDFYKSTQGKFQTEVGKMLAEEIITRRLKMQTRSSIPAQDA